MYHLNWKSTTILLQWLFCLFGIRRLVLLIICSSYKSSGYVNYFTGPVSSNTDNRCCSDHTSVSEQASEQKHNHKQLRHSAHFVGSIQVKPIHLDAR